MRILINQVSNQYNQGRKELRPRLFKLYQFGLAHDLFIDNQQMGTHLFTNVATIGTLEQQFDWVEQFIQQYGSYLPEAVRTDTICLSEALLALHAQQYQRVIERLSNYSFTEVFLVLRSKGILLRAYFELFTQDESYYDVLIAQMEAFKKYLRRHQFISETKKITYLHFVSFTQRMANQYFKSQLTEQLYQQIEESDSVVLKNWLLKQYKQLSQKKKKLP